MLFTPGVSPTPADQNATPFERTEARTVAWTEGSERLWKRGLGGGETCGGSEHGTLSCPPGGVSLQFTFGQPRGKLHGAS